MYPWFWRSPLKGRSAAHSLLASATVLVLVVGMFTASLFLARPAAAAAAKPQAPFRPAITGGTRLETFFVTGYPDGQMYHQWSDDNGNTWSQPALVPAPYGIYPFVTAPAVVSDKSGSLYIVVQTSVNSVTPLGSLSYTSYASGFTVWNTIPGANFSAIDTLRINNVDYVFGSPVVSSWGPGRLDLFLSAGVAYDPHSYLLHTWMNNSTWSGQWDVWQTNFTLQGDPAAVSWGSGRIDVFVRDGNNNLEHKWFDNSQWSGWENLGGYIITSPTASSSGVGYFNVFANGDGEIVMLPHWPSGWGSWASINSSQAVYSTPAAAELAGTIQLFALDQSGRLIHRSWVNQWWFDWSQLPTLLSGYLAAVAWTPPPPVVKVPNVIGTDEDSAAATLTQAGLVVAYGRQQDFSCRQPEFFVVTESPGPNTVQPIGSTITLTVSSGYDRAGNPCFPSS